MRPQPASAIGGIGPPEPRAWRGVHNVKIFHMVRFIQQAITATKLGAGLGLLLAFTTAAQAGYDQGLAAFGQGQFEVAIEEFRALAEEGHPGAEFMLGVMYFNGTGVPQDSKAAAIFFYQAAQQGDASAQLALGSIFIRGVGVWQDLIQAHIWLSLAAINGPTDLQGNAVALRDATRRLMTPDEIAEAQRLVAAWRPTRSGLVWER